VSAMAAWARRYDARATGNGGEAEMKFTIIDT
jgi:hypothetical protein